jgi:hypothetical protein
MRTFGIVLVLMVACVSSLVAQERPVADVVFAAALDNVWQELAGAPPINLQHLRDGRDLPADAIVVARRTIGGAPIGYRAFVDKYFGSVIAEELLQSYGDNGPAPRTIDQAFAGHFAILPVDRFETGPFEYDWQRLNQEYPQARYVVRLSWPAVDHLGTYAVVRYELIGRDRPSTLRSPWPWQHASFVKFEKQRDGSWKRGIGVIGGIWN